MKTGVPIWLFSILVGLSLLIFTLSTVLLVGLENSSYDAMDGNGRRMGFNGYFSSDHYAIMFQNFHPRLMLQNEYTWDCLFFGANLVGLILLARPRRKALLVFFGCQLALAPIAFFGGLLCLQDIEAIFRGGMDRESFVDIPKWNILLSLPFWVAASSAIFFGLLESRMGSAAGLPKPRLVGTSARVFEQDKQP